VVGVLLLLLLLLPPLLRRLHYKPADLERVVCRLSPPSPLLAADDGLILASSSSCQGGRLPPTGQRAAQIVSPSVRGGSLAERDRRRRWSRAQVSARAQRQPTQD
jgi:hypothetical protein